MKRLSLLCWSSAKGFDLSDRAIELTGVISINEFRTYFLRIYILVAAVCVRSAISHFFQVCHLQRLDLTCSRVWRKVLGLCQLILTLPQPKDLRPLRHGSQARRGAMCSGAARTWLGGLAAPCSLHSRSLKTILPKQSLTTDGLAEPTSKFGTEDIQRICPSVKHTPTQPQAIDSTSQPAGTVRFAETKLRTEGKRTDVVSHAPEGTRMVAFQIRRAQLSSTRCACGEREPR